MYLTSIIIDIISDDKKLKTITIFPRRTNEKVIVEHLSNLNSSKDKSTFGTVQIYNLDNCKIKVNELDLKAIHGNGADLFFSIDHIGIPIGNPSKHPMGMYNLILPQQYNLQDFHIVDPYDDKKNDIEKKHFQYETLFDNKQNRHVVKMYLHSAKYDTFSLKVFGSASKEKVINSSLNVINGKNIIADIADSNYEYSFGKKAKKFIKNLSKYLELKPNVVGIGLNINSILEDQIDD